jgi:threonine dehydrogenase-like Zn-dependent dehydrogenase
VDERAMTDNNISPIAQALWYVARGQAELREQKLGALKPDTVRIKTLWSGVSRGTERLVFMGKVSSLDQDDMRAPMQEGTFPFPVKYGYCAVGMVEDGPSEWLGRTVFALHPHQNVFDTPLSLIAAVPDHVPPRRAVLAANMETALNALWDSGASAGQRIVVIGAGLVGLLVGYLAAQLPGAEVTMVDIDLSRKDIAARMGCDFQKPLDAPHNADIVFHASASESGLACALACAGNEARIIEMSWYGMDEIRAPLGLAFHHKRLHLISSQVGQVSPLHRPRWSHQRRLAKALELLQGTRGASCLDALITQEVAFADLPRVLPEFLAPSAKGLASVVRY